jgi:putative intracellular protease/amidase
MKILMVLTSHDRLGNTGRKMGFFGWRSSQLHTASSRTPARRFRSHRPAGGSLRSIRRARNPKIRRRHSLGSSWIARRRPRWLIEQKLSSVVARDYDAVFHPGGDGPLWDLAEDPQSIALIETIYASGKARRSGLPCTRRPPPHLNARWCASRQRAIR